MTPMPGQVYWAFHDKRRPVVVISREELNRGNYVVVVPLTSARLATRRTLPNCVPLDPKHHGVPKPCVVQAEMVAVVTKNDLQLDAPPITTLDRDVMCGVIRAIGYAIAADCTPT